MYLYTTTVSPGVASPVKVMEWAANLTQKINQISSVPTTLWTSAMSPGMGTMAFTSVVSDLSIIEDTETKLAADPGYMNLVEQAIGLLSATAPADQMLMQLVHGDPDGAINAQYATTVRATLAPGSAAAGVELGVNIAQKVKKITGLPTSFATGVTGDYGAVMWVTLAETIQQVQAANEAVSADAEFAKQLDKEASKAYAPGAVQTISRKIA